MLHFCLCESLNPSQRVVVGLLQNDIKVLAISRFSREADFHFVSFRFYSEVLELFMLKSRTLCFAFRMQILIVAVSCAHVMSTRAFSCVSMLDCLPHRAHSSRQRWQTRNRRFGVSSFPKHEWCVMSTISSACLVRSSYDVRIATAFPKTRRHTVRESVADARMRLRVRRVDGPQVLRKEYTRVRRLSHKRRFGEAGGRGHLTKYFSWLTVPFESFTAL